MSEHKNGEPEEPMLFGMPLSMYPKAPPLEDREPTLWEFLKLGWWPAVPVLPYTPPARRGKERG